MNPFLEIPVCLAGDKDTPEKEVTGRVLPGEIAFHYPGYHWGAVIVLKSGHSILTSLTCADIDAARNAYYELMKKNPMNVANIQLQPKKSRLRVTDQFPTSKRDI